jgi:dCTP deaminase
MVVNNRSTIENFIRYAPKDNDNRHLRATRIEKSWKKWQFDLRLGDEYFLSGDEYPKMLSDDEQFIVIKPGKFGILLTDEKIDLDNKHMGLISVKFTYKKKGLINVSGFHVDPNYKGKLIFTVFNAGPKDIYIKRGAEVFMIFFVKLEQAVEEESIKGYDSIPVDMIEGLGGNSLTLAENNRKIEQLDFYVKIIFGLIVVLIGVLLKNVFK